MIQKMKRTMIALALMAGVLLPAVAVQPVSAQIDQGSKDAACAGLGAVGESCSSQDASGSITRLLRTVISLLSWVVGIVSIIMMIVGSLKYITSNGDSNAINSAKSTITYALIGVVIAALAQVLVQFVLARTSGVTCNNGVCTEQGSSTQFVVCDDGRRVSVSSASAGVGRDALCR